MNIYNNRFCHERELWWCTLEVNVGFEQDGSDIEYRRPILILKGLSKETCLVIPLTTSKNVHKLRPTIGLVEDKEACALLSQMKVIDTKRLVRKIGNLDKKIFENIKKLSKACFNSSSTFCLLRGEAEATCIYILVNTEWKSRVSLVQRNMSIK